MIKILKYFFISIFLMLGACAVFLFVMARFHQERVHSKILEFVNSQFNEQVTIGDFSLSYLRDLPHMHIGLTEIDFLDAGKSVLKVDKVDLAVNLRGLKNKKIIIEEAEISGLAFNSVTDSAGNKPHLFDKTGEHKDASGATIKLEIEEVIIKDSRIHTGNQYKGSKNYLSIYSMRLRPVINTDFTDISFTLTGNLDSLFSNRKLLIRNQPLSVPSATLRLHKNSKIVELIDGEVFSNNLKLVPRLKLAPEGKSKHINLRIDATGNFDNVLSLVELHLDEKFKQVRPDAKITGSYKQYGITDAFTKPNSEIDFLVENAEMEGENLPYNVQIHRMKGYYNTGKERSRETTLIQIDTLSAQIGSSTIAGNLHVENLINPYIKTELTSDINIADFVKKTMDIEASGDILLNVRYEGLVSELKKMRYSGYLGRLDFKDIMINIGKQGKIISVPGGSMVLNNHVLDIGRIRGTINKEQFSFEGIIQNPLLHLVNKNEDLSAKLFLAFDRLELGLKPDSAGNKPRNFWAALWSVFADHVAVDLKLTGKKLVANNFEIKNITLSASQNDNIITINSFGLSHERDNVSGKGSLTFSKKGITSLVADLTGSFDNLDSLLKAGSGKKSGSGNFPILPKNTRISVSLSAKTGTLGPVKASNMKLKALLSDENVLIKDLSLTIPEGRIALTGNISLDSAGFSGGALDLSTDFNSFVVDDWINKLKSQNSKGSQNKKLAFPKGLAVGVNTRVKDLLFKDLYIRDFAATATLTDQVITLGSLNAKLPFGTAAIKASISDFSSELPKISGTIDLDLASASIDTILAMQAFHSENKNSDALTKKTTGTIPLFKTNLDLSLIINAEEITYKGAVAEKVKFDFRADESKAEIRNLDLLFASGSIQLNGYMLNSKKGNYPCYLSTSISKVRIEELIAMFDGFNQDLITPDNTSGEFSWNSDHHFSLNPDNTLNLNDNLWYFNFNIHDAILTDVAPIQDALFFIGHKAKSKMVVKDLNLQAYMYNDKLLFSEVLMNDNIANLEIFGSYSLTDSIMDFGSKISLTDLFFRSKKERMLETTQGIVPLEQDAKVYIRLQGNPSNHKIHLNNRKKITRFEKELIGEIGKANKDFLKRESKRKATNPF